MTVFTNQAAWVQQMPALLTAHSLNIQDLCKAFTFLWPSERWLTKRSWAMLMFKNHTSICGNATGIFHGSLLLGASRIVIQNHRCHASRMSFHHRLLLFYRLERAASRNTACEKTKLQLPLSPWVLSPTESASRESSFLVTADFPPIKTTGSI